MEPSWKMPWQWHMSQHLPYSKELGAKPWPEYAMFCGNVLWQSLERKLKYLYVKLSEQNGPLCLFSPLSSAVIVLVCIFPCQTFSTDFHGCEIMCRKVAGMLKKRIALTGWLIAVVFLNFRSHAILFSLFFSILHYIWSQEWHLKWLTHHWLPILFLGKTRDGTGQSNYLQHGF